MASKNINTLMKSLSNSVNEKDVENAWRNFIVKSYDGGMFSSPLNCDGLFKIGNVNLLCEFKYDIKLNTHDHYGVLAQVIYYLKRFQDNSITIPNVVFIGDKDECIVMPVIHLSSYLKNNYDWTISPSDAGKNLFIISDLMKDDNLHPFVFKVNNDFQWIPIHNYIDRSVCQAKADVSITCKTLPVVFEYWRKHVVKHNLSENEHIELFFKVLTSPQDCYKHPKKDGCLVCSNNEFKIDKRGFNGFFSIYKETHNPVELRELIANKDRLIQEISRRRTGAFFTPSDWVQEAHNMLAEHFGINWKNEYVVWDASCGTANLTRDYSFNELYLSTLEQTDLNIIAEAGYNSNATKFQFDFLNDSLDKLPDGLKTALKEGKKIIFLNNPPYATACNLDIIDGKENKIGVASSTMVNNMMKNQDIGPSSQQLYAQFMYRIMNIIQQYNLKDAVMATFTTPIFMQGESFEDFRKLINVNFIDGMLFQASHFADVSNSWGISFTIFKF